MIISTKIGPLDVDQIVHINTYDKQCGVNTNGVHIPLHDPEDKLLVEFFYSAGAITGDSILALAEQIRAIRGPFAMLFAEAEQLR